MYYNVEHANRFDGKDKGYMWEAQGLALAKPVLTTAGSIAIGVGAALSWTGVGLLVAGAGAAAVILGNAIKVDEKTGERSTKMTDRDALNSALTIGGAAIGGGTATQIASSAVSATASNGFQFDENGTMQGFDLSGASGDAALRQFGVSMAAMGASAGASSMFNGDTARIAGSLASSATSSVLNSAIQHNIGTYQNLSGAAALGAGLAEATSLVGGYYKKDLVKETMTTEQYQIKQAMKAAATKTANGMGNNNRIHDLLCRNYYCNNDFIYVLDGNNTVMNL